MVKISTRNSAVAQRDMSSQVFADGLAAALRDYRGKREEGEKEGGETDDDGPFGDVENVKVIESYVEVMLECPEGEAHDNSPSGSLEEHEVEEGGRSEPVPSVDATVALSFLFCVFAVIVAVRYRRNANGDDGGITVKYKPQINEDDDDDEEIGTEMEMVQNY